ncbi:MAG TPA: nucleotide exchange factor GrpE [Candidatus Saccharimonadia bacterium]|nr:nucleotide exchange factor GrpE [Candidatus Saccharimonadia bacterium]
MSKKTTQPDDLATQVEELTQDLQRVQAEFMNFKRRVEEEKTELLGFAKSRIVREFLTVRDNFDQELAHRPAGIDAQWAASIDAIRKQFDAVLTGLGVRRFDSQGHAFDPRRHQAVTMEDGAGEHEVVLDELQPGYERDGVVLRPAVVKVGHSDTPPPEAAGNAQAAEIIEAEQTEPEAVQPHHRDTEAD